MASIQVRDVTGALACVGLWGPSARDVVARVSGDDWSNASFPYYTMRSWPVGEVPVRALRVSYVGELGWELYTSPEYGARLWELLWEAGQPDGISRGRPRGVRHAAAGEGLPALGRRHAHRVPAGRGRGGVRRQARQGAVHRDAKRWTCRAGQR